MPAAGRAVLAAAAAAFTAASSPPPPPPPPPARLSTTLLLLAAGAVCGAAASSACWWWWWGPRRQRRRRRQSPSLDGDGVDADDDEDGILLPPAATKQQHQHELVHKHCRERIYAERAGRIAAERAIRNEVVRAIASPAAGFPTLVIGSVESPFVGKRGTPRQGLLVAESRGVVQLHPEIPVEALDGLESYSHVFIFFIFHQNTNLPKVLLRSAASAAASSASNDNTTTTTTTTTTTAALGARATALRTSTFNAKVPTFAARVFPPLLRGESTGVFATRSPHHPNPFGQTLVRVLAVDRAARRIAVAGLDLCDGTPVVDIKPWNPADCPRCLFAGAQAVGNGKDEEEEEREEDEAAEAEARVVRIPEWVARGVRDPYELPVRFAPAAARAMREAVEAGRLRHYARGEGALLRTAVAKILALDIRSFHQGRGRKAGGGGGVGAGGDGGGGGDGEGGDEEEGEGATKKGNKKKKKKRAVDAARMAEDSATRGQDWELDYDVLNIKFCVRKGFAAAAGASAPSAEERKRRRAVDGEGEEDEGWFMGGAGDDGDGEDAAGADLDADRCWVLVQQVTVR